MLGFAGGSAALVILLLVVGWPINTFRLSQEFTPAEDRAVIQMPVNAPEGASLQYLDRHLQMVAAIAEDEVRRGTPSASTAVPARSTARATSTTAR